MVAKAAIVDIKLLGGKVIRRHTRKATQVRFYSAPITDADLNHLAHYPHLTTLQFQYCRNITGEGLDPQAFCPRLQHLQFYRCDRLSTLASMTGSANLRSLCLEGSQIDDTELARLPTLFPNLRNLDLQSMPRITDKGILGLIDLTQLHRLDIGYNGLRLTDEIASALAKMTKLKIFRATSTHNLGDETCSALATLPRLNTIHLCDSRITAVGLTHLHACHSLRKLHLSRTSVANSAIEQLRSCLPECQCHTRAYNGDHVNPSRWPEHDHLYR